MSDDDAHEAAYMSDLDDLLDALRARLDPNKGGHAFPDLAGLRREVERGEPVTIRAGDQEVVVV